MTSNYPLWRKLPPPYAVGSRHPDLMSRFTVYGLLRWVLCSGGNEVWATAISISSQIKMENRESLNAEMGCQALQSGQIFVHDLLWSKLPHAHRVLLESVHKVCEHSSNPEPRQDTLSGNVSGKRPRDAAEKAVGWSTNTLICLTTSLKAVLAISTNKNEVLNAFYIYIGKIWLLMWLVNGPTLYLAACADAHICIFK